MRLNDASAAFFMVSARIIRKEPAPRSPERGGILGRVVIGSKPTLRLRKDPLQVVQPLVDLLGRLQTHRGLWMAQADKRIQQGLG